MRQQFSGGRIATLAFHGRSTFPATAIQKRAATTPASVQRPTTSVRSTASVVATVVIHTKAANARVVAPQVARAPVLPSFGSATLASVGIAVPQLLELCSLGV